jgi:steroid delta-isomerase-like uncharacterized protein
MSDVNKATLRRLIEEMDKGNLDIIDQLFTPDYICHLQGGSATLDRQTHKKTLQSFYAAFPDYHHRIEDLIAEGDKVVLRVTDLGTHNRDYQGIPATGRQISISAMFICRFVGGKIAEAWMEADLLGFYKQIGVIDDDDLEKTSSFIPTEDI